MADLDVLWNGYSHQEIVEMVNTGPGASLTAAMEDRLERVAQVLDDLSDQVNKVIQRTGADWQGRAADMATNAMWVLRNIDDGMYFTSNLAGIRAFGQSDSAGWVRTNMPPVVKGQPPEPTGGLIDIFRATVDFQNQQAAAKQAEQRAREIMQQYTEATRERAAAMTPLTPVPEVVLEISEREPAGPGSNGGSPQHPGERVVGPRSGGPVDVAQPRSTNPHAGSASTEAALAPAQGTEPIVHDSPQRTVPPAAGGSGMGAPLPAGRGSGERPRNEKPGRGGASAGGRGPVGGPPAAGAAPAGRGRTTIARGAAGGFGATAPFGAGPGARREEDREHRARFGLPSAEHFESGDGARDPHREGWHVAPSVIGDGDEDGDNQ